MRYPAFIFFCASVFTAFPAQATCNPSPGNIPGNCCSSVGKTVMDDNNQNIIACVCDTIAGCDKINPANLIWKAMSNSKININIGCSTAGDVMTGIDKGIAKCVAITGKSSECPAQIVAQTDDKSSCNLNGSNSPSAVSPGVSKGGTAIGLSGYCLRSSTTKADDSSFAGSATCADGTWQCLLYQIPSNTIVGQLAYNGPCSGMPILR